MQIKIRQLRVLDAVVRLGSFTEAAKAMHVTPAALSLAIRELEDILGFRVLERTTRRLRLTDAGRGYLVHAQRVLAEIDGAERFAHNTRAGHEVVRVATTQTVIATLLIHVLPAVYQRFDRLRLQPLDVAAGGIVDALLTGSADMAIGVGLPDDEVFEARPLFVSRWFAYMAPGHRLAQRPQLDWSDVADEPLFMTQSANYLRLRAALGKDLELADVQDATTATAGIAMAATGAGIAVFPGYAQPLATMLGARGVPIDTPALRHALWIAVRQDTASSAQVVAMRDLVTDVLAATCQHLV